jgi:hypothetical protein
MLDDLNLFFMMPEEAFACHSLYCFPTLAVDGVLDIAESKPARGKASEQGSALSGNWAKAG